MINKKPLTLKGNRRVLLDMHIPDWEEGFLREFNPIKLADNFALAKVDSAMIYTQSHVGLCYWPVKIGKPHPALKSHDWVKEMTNALTEKGIEVFGYYSVIFNNQSFLEHKEWRISPRPNMSGGAFHGERYGHICPNNEQYRDFTKAQLKDLLSSHSFDAFFIDMAFWPGICQCNTCQQKFEKEYGKKIPTTINWNHQDWSDFQDAREKWLNEFASEIKKFIQEINPNMPVYYNFAVGLFNWRWGINFDFSKANDFLGGDFYGSPDEQFLMSRLMINLSEQLPFEFMTSRCIHLTDHVESKPQEQILIQAFASLASNAAFRIIDAIDPSGVLNVSFYQAMEEINAQLMQYNTLSDGVPVEDILVYISDASKMNFNENGLALTDHSKRFNPSPHIEAVKGVVSTLKEAHLPVGVITKKQLNELDKYPLIILPNILRISPEEVNAFRRYVQNGGHIYASGITSLTAIDGTKSDDFLLNEVFGVSFIKELPSEMLYFKMEDSCLKTSVLEQEYMSQKAANSGAGKTMQVKPMPNAKILATLNFPYKVNNDGSVFNSAWSSIHSSPPYEDTDLPAIVENNYEKGRCTYSCSDIESSELPSHKLLFKQLILNLLPSKPSFCASAHPDIWMTAFDFPEEKFYEINFLNFSQNLPAIAHYDIGFEFSASRKQIFKKIILLPSGESIPFSLDDEGNLKSSLPKLTHFVRLKLIYV